MSDPFTLTCQTGFFVLGMQKGERAVTAVRVATTCVTLTITSAWTFKKISRLSLFYVHWLSGLVMELCFAIEDLMITVCWTGSNLAGFIKTIKYIELAASNMLAITNLAICVNLALIVLSHRTMSRVRSVSSPPLILVFLAISMVIAAATVPFWEGIIILGTGFWAINSDGGENDFILASIFYVEFFVGICMFSVVALLLLFRMEEIKQCWKLHSRIRYYFGLTILGTVVNLGLGVCGTINLFLEEPETLLTVWSWIFRYIHIALDTIVLHGALRERNMDERSDEARSSTFSSGFRGRPVETISRGSGEPMNPSKTGENAPVV